MDKIMATFLSTLARAWLIDQTALELLDLVQTGC